MNTPAKLQTPTPATIEAVLIRGDLSKLTEAQRTEYYMRVCHSLGLNPLTKPFDYLTLSGKLVLYAKRDAADQLRKLNGISITIVGQEEHDGLLTVHARATDKTGRTDEDFGVVAFKGGGNEFAANAIMKAVTKAKRRVTLSISGLGLLDETEVESVPADDDLIAEHDAPKPQPGDPDYVNLSIPLATELRARRLAKSADDLDTATGYKAPYKISAQSWRMFASILETELRAAESKSDVFEWLKLNQANIDAMKDKFPKMYESLGKVIEAAKAEPT